MTGKTGNRRKRTVVLAAWLLAVCILVSGCAARSGESAGGSARGDDARDRISVVTTIFPQYDFVRQIAGESLASSGEKDLRDSVERDLQQKQLQKQITALENKIRKEKQLNRQVELNAELKKLRKELDDLI